MPSFDVYVEVNWHEVTNGVDQTTREMQTRYDFKGSKSTLTLDQEKEEIILVADDDMKLRAVQDMLKQRLAKRNVSLSLFEFKDAEKVGGGLLKQVIKIKAALEQADLKEINKAITAAKLKVNSQIQGEQLRVNGKKRDDLQETIAFLKTTFTKLDLQFGNFRD